MNRNTKTDEGHYMTRSRCLLFSASTLAALFLLLELSLTLFFPLDSIKPFELIIFTGKSYYVEDVETIWRMKGNARITQKNVEIDLNSYGFRDQEFNPAENSTRVLCLGGSTTFGWGVSTEHTFPKQLESELHACYPGKAFRVMNAGIPGFTSFQGLKLLENNRELFNPDWIVFSFTFNDQSKRAKSIVDIYEYLHSPVFALRKFLYSFQSVRLVARTSQLIVDNLPLPIVHPDNMQNAVSLDDYQSTVSHLIQFCSENAIRLILLGEVSHSEGDTEPDRYKLSLSQIARRHQIDYYDVETIFSLEPLEVITDEPKETAIGKSNQPIESRLLMSETTRSFPKEIKDRLLDSCHYTADGNALIARELLKSFLHVYGECGD